MNKSRDRFLFIVFLLAVLSACAPSQIGQPVIPQSQPIIFFNGIILTMENGGQAQAIAVENGKILAVGGNDESIDLSGQAGKQAKNLTVTFMVTVK